MCGRISQAREDPDVYFRILRWEPPPGLLRRASPNIPPGTCPLTLHRLTDGSPQAAVLFWGYRPPWYQRGPASNARLDTVLRGGAFWRPLLTRRVLVPVDGWYEWTGDKGAREPWYISAQDGAPILLAGITAWTQGKVIDAHSGFAIVTDDAAGGMVDLHDRRPIALKPEDAATWVDPLTQVHDALELLSTARPESAFQWWRVTKAVGNSRYQESDATAPTMPARDGPGH